MIILFSYPELYGLSDNNPYGLKVATFLRLCGLQYQQEHVIDTANAPRGQLPYIVDDGQTIGDSDAIISHLIEKYQLKIDAKLTVEQHNAAHLVNRMLDDLYWVMSYSRWRDPEFWPLFKNELIKSHPDIVESTLEAARKYNFERYRYQGIGRYSAEEVYKRGMEDLHVLANLIGEKPFIFGAEPHRIDAAIYGFLANIYFFQIDTPLKRFVLLEPSLVRHCNRIHAMVA